MEVELNATLATNRNSFSIALEDNPILEAEVEFFVGTYTIRN